MLAFISNCKWGRVQVPGLDRTQHSWSFLAVLFCQEANLVLYHPVCNEWALYCYIFVWMCNWCLRPPLFLFTGCKETMFSSSLDSAPELPRALSLLSTNSWVSSEPESISFDQHLHVNPSSMSLHVDVMPSLPLGSSDYWQIEQQQQQPQHSTTSQFHNFSNSGGQSQEIQLFRPHYHGIYSHVLD